MVFFGCSECCKACGWPGGGWLAFPDSIEIDITAPGNTKSMAGRRTHATYTQSQPYNISASVTVPSLSGTYSLARKPILHPFSGAIIGFTQHRYDSQNLTITVEKGEGDNLEIRVTRAFTFSVEDQLAYGSSGLQSQTHHVLSMHIRSCSPSVTYSYSCTPDSYNEYAPSNTFYRLQQGMVSSCGNPPYSLPNTMSSRYSFRFRRLNPPFQSTVENIEVFSNTFPVTEAFSDGGYPGQSFAVDEDFSVTEARAYYSGTPDPYLIFANAEG